MVSVQSLHHLASNKICLIVYNPAYVDSMDHTETL